MKFKKVEIQAFRAYNKAEDSTFDFATKTTDGADFISIYAPNGFGKTSFYDAVEWGFTNNINRFLRKDKDNQDSAKAERTSVIEQGNKQKQYIIRNKYSAPSLEGYVKLYTTKGEMVRSMPQIRTGQPDFKFDPKETDETRAYFQDVLLSQEWIDAFLREDNAEIRYNKFIEYFGDKELDKNYKILISLLQANENKLEKLKKELKAYQLELRYDLDSNILTTINEKIEILNSRGEKIPIVDLSFSEKEFLVLSNLVSERSIELNSKILDADSKIITIDEKMADLNNYLDAKLNIDILNKDLIALLKFRSLLKDKVDISNRIDHLQIQIKEFEKEYERYLDIQKMFDQFLTIKKEEERRNSEITITKGKLEISDKTIETLKKELSQNNVKKESIQKQISDLEISQNGFPIILQALSDKKVELEKSKENLLDPTKNSIILLTEINKIKSEISELELKENNIINNVYPSVFEKENEKYVRLINSLENTERELKKLNAPIKEIASLISTHESLNKDLNQLISFGLELVNKNKLSACPLCTHPYSSFDELSNKITNNPAIAETLKKLLIEKKEAEEEVEKTQLIYSNLKDELNQQIRNEIKQLKEDLKKKENQYANLNGLIKTENAIIEKLEIEIRDLVLKTEGLSLEDHVSLTKSKIDLLTESRKLITIDLEKQNEQKIKLEQEIETFKKEIQLNIDILTKRLQEREVIAVNEFLKEKHISDYNSFNFSDLMKASKVKIDSLIDSEKLLKNNLSRLNEDLSSVNADTIENEIQTKESNVIIYKRVTTSFEQFLTSQLSISIENTALDNIITIVNSEKEKLILKRNENKLLKEDFHKINEYKENVVPFLKQKKLEKSIRDAELQIVFQRDTVGKKLSDEKSKLSDFIHLQVESFFYETLINSLYQKIDPHPEYKKIKFRCDFTGDKPKLNVFVSVKNDETTLLVPNLYFSTAQLNVLSLSIFLAKALNAKDSEQNPVDCIFIDDPIQSMDSINILSTIDLLRSIMVNLNKQIILSTHDENFHRLLQKKIPEGIFNSTFIELETFGKVKARAS